MKTIMFNNVELKFDRTSKCDWCGDKKKVGITHYGTRDCYNRLICNACAERIKKFDFERFGIDHEKGLQENKNNI